MKRYSQHGVALVITLIMLSLVTFMAIVFLAVSRRERGAVTNTTDQTTSTLMANAGLAQAESEVVARIKALTNYLQYEMFVSTNFIDPGGFKFGADPYLTNVSYSYPNGQPLQTRDRIINIAKLLFRPRAPVFVDTNLVQRPANQPPAPLEFRYYLDLNRNGQFETNGWLPALDARGNLIPAVDANGRTLPNQYVSNYYVGDPEWIGVLEKPGQPHSANNRFIGRYAFLVLPTGKSLDLNFIYNQSKQYAGAPLPTGPNDDFYRNQGVGSWELNLAAFLNDLNTNQWPVGSYSYTNILTVPNKGKAFMDARDLLLRGRGDFLFTVRQFFGAAGVNAFANDLIDEYSASPFMSGTTLPTLDRDNTLANSQLWPGSGSKNQFADMQELFNIATYLPGFDQRIKGTGNVATARSTYDRYTFYRLLSQMGVDSTSTAEGKLNINYQNQPFSLLSADTFTPWTNAAAFFTNAAAQLLKTQMDFISTPLSDKAHPILIPIRTRSSDSGNFVWLNYYSAAVHRMLQLAANIYDATTNHYELLRTRVGPAPPSVFRPVFALTNLNGSKNSSLCIVGYKEVNNAQELNFLPWLDITNAMVQLPKDGQCMIYGVPLVVGAKKGYPNFNEYAMQTAVQVSRKLQISKDARSFRPNQTNQMYILGVSNTFGVEAWNSYTSNFARPLDLRVTNQFIISLLWTNYDGTPATPIIFPPPLVGTVHFNTNVPANVGWPALQFKVPFMTNLVYLVDAAYRSQTRTFIPFNTNIVFDTAPNFPVPQWILSISNRLTYAAIDHDSGRIVDFVNLDGLNTSLDLTRSIIGNLNFGESSASGSFWVTNRVGNIPMGIRNQVLESLGQSSNGPAIWTDSNQNPATGQAKQKAIDLFRVFMGLQPFKYPTAQMQQELGNSLSHQLPYTPTRKIYQNISWQANDPLVHYTYEDLVDPYGNTNVQFAVPPSNMPTNSNLGQLNRRFSPWGGNPHISSDPNAMNVAIKDPLVRNSDDWDFPTNRFPNIGWLGRVHRGTPWQTVYMKAPVINTNVWRNWTVNIFTHPTNDWKLFDVFTVAPSANAARGLLSVNQTNQAAWSAVLSGVGVLSNSFARVRGQVTLTPLLIQPASPQLRQIVDNINLTRSQMPGQVFRHVGDVLASPGLTTASPFLFPVQEANVSDEVYERIPQQIMSLIKADEPRVTIYTFGQALAPVGPPVISPGQPYHLMYTNYQVTAEVVAKHMVRVGQTNNFPIVVPEKFQYSTLE